MFVKISEKYLFVNKYHYCPNVIEINSIGYYQGT